MTVTTRRSFAGSSHKAEIKSKLSDSMRKRVERRLNDVSYLGNGVFYVSGNTVLGDAYPGYRVTLTPPHCDCYDHGHGEHRVRRGCSHVLACQMWKVSHREEIARVHDEADAEREDRQEGDDEQRGLERDIESSLPTLALDDPSLIPNGWSPLIQQQWAADGRFDYDQWNLQVTAAQEIVGHFEAGVKLVMCDAPTGSGKTAIADLVSRLMGTKAVYVCERKPLQDQVLADFDYARVLKGRSNYPTQRGPSDVTCDDCDATPGENDCTFCESIAGCPYRVAKRSALQAQLAVLNTAYWVREVNYVGDFAKGSKLLIVDECDTLEAQLHSFIEFRVTNGRCRQLGVQPPKKGSHHTTIATWLKEVFVPAVTSEAAKMPMSTVIGRRRKKQLVDLRDEATRISDAITSDAEWVRENDQRDSPLLMKPVSVAPYGEKYVWDHVEKVLMMSATIISPEELAESLGFEGEWAVVRVPMTFPVENRIVHVAPVANVTAKTQEEAWPKLKTAVLRIMGLHPNERILVHTVSYKLAQYLVARLQGEANGRPLLTYTEASQRMDALEMFKASQAGVLFASSFERGVDLRGDECSVVVVAKVPWPSMGDAAVKKRANAGRAGEAWYAVQTVRSLVQMTGRHVRSKDDVGVSYILDSQFTKNLYKRHRELFPEWWRESLDRGFRVKDLM